MLTEELVYRKILIHILSKFVLNSGIYLQVVTGIALPSGSDKLYTGSQDETVRVWDCQSGQVVFICFFMHCSYFCLLEDFF